MSARRIAALALLLTACAAPGSAPGSAFPTLPEAELAHASAVLSELIAARGVSGHEGPVRDVIVEQLHRLDPSWEPVVDEAGNLLLVLGQGERSLLFVAHTDEVGLQVTAVREGGLLVMAKRGGFHDHLYQGTAIELVTSGGVLPGIALPPSETDGAFIVDVGARSAEQAAAWGIAVGDAATVPKELNRLGRHRVAGRSNDDRVGSTALLLALEQLDVSALDRKVVFAWVTEEEIGLYGSSHLARSWRPVPETVFPVDTFVSSDSPRDDPYYAHAPLGAGPVLRAYDSTSITPPAALDRVRSIAAGHDIPLQTGTMGGGNDGSPFMSYGAVDVPLAWPQRNSHSRVETLDLRDLVHLGRLVAAVAAEY